MKITYQFGGCCAFSGIGHDRPCHPARRRRRLDEITARFYDAMFADHPELLDGTCSTGATRPTATSARRSPDPSPPSPRPARRTPTSGRTRMLSRIAHKHASLGITPDQYAIVHKYLFGAIAEVLGDAVTPEVAAAWDEVYWLMANALIALEARLYDERGSTGRHLAAVAVVERRRGDRRRGLLHAAPGRRRPAAACPPGPVRQRRASRCPTARTRSGSTACPAPPARRTARITVKRVARRRRRPGRARSPTCCTRNVRAGRRADRSPRRSATWSSTTADAPLLLASAGIGCTPMLGMLDHLAATGSARQVTVLHADRSPADHALRAGHSSSWSPSCPAPPCDRSGTSGRGSRARRRARGLVDLTGIDLPDTPSPTCAARCRSCATSAASCSRAGVPAARHPLRGLRPRPLARQGLTARRCRRTGTGDSHAGTGRDGQAPAFHAPVPVGAARHRRSHAGAGGDGQAPIGCQTVLVSRNAVIRLVPGSADQSAPRRRAQDALEVLRRRLLAGPSPGPASATPVRSMALTSMWAASQGASSAADR